MEGARSAARKLRNLFSARLKKTQKQKKQNNEETL